MAKAQETFIDLAREAATLPCSFAEMYYMVLGKLHDEGSLPANWQKQEEGNEEAPKASDEIPDAL